MCQFGAFSPNLSRVHWRIYFFNQKYETLPMAAKQGALLSTLFPRCVKERQIAEFDLCATYIPSCVYETMTVWAHATCQTTGASMYNSVCIRQGLGSVWVRGVYRSYCVSDQNPPLLHLLSVSWLACLRAHKASRWWHFRARKPRILWSPKQSSRDINILVCREWNCHRKNICQHDLGRVMAPPLMEGSVPQWTEKLWSEGREAGEIQKERDGQVEMYQGAQLSQREVGGFNRNHNFIECKCSS